VGGGVTEHPATAVHVDDDRERALGALRLDDPHARVAYARRHSDPLLVDRQLLDWRGLKIVEDVAGGDIPQLVEERRF
jgi:hypothetical protein